MGKNLKTIFITVGVFAVLLLLMVIYFQFIAASPEEPLPSQEVIVKAPKKTYLKYIALKDEISLSEEPTVFPTLTTIETSLTPTVPADTPTPSPTEIIVALSTPTVSATEEAQTTISQAPIAQLPTTGLIRGSIVAFLIAASMIIFAFVL